MSDRFRRIRFRRRRGDLLFEVDVLVVRTAAWPARPESRDPQWQAVKFFSFTLGLRLTLDPEVAAFCDRAACPPLPRE